MTTSSNNPIGKLGYTTENNLADHIFLYHAEELQRMRKNVQETGGRAGINSLSLLVHNVLADYGWGEGKWFGREKRVWDVITKLIKDEQPYGNDSTYTSETKICFHILARHAENLQDPSREQKLKQQAQDLQKQAQDLQKQAQDLQKQAQEAREAAQGQGWLSIEGRDLQQQAQGLEQRAQGLEQRAQDLQKQEQCLEKQTLTYKIMEEYGWHEKGPLFESRRKRVERAIEKARVFAKIRSAVQLISGVDSSLSALSEKEKKTLQTAIDLSKRDTWITLVSNHAKAIIGRASEYSSNDIDRWNRKIERLDANNKQQEQLLESVRDAILHRNALIPPRELGMPWIKAIGLLSEKHHLTPLMESFNRSIEISGKGSDQIEVSIRFTCNKCVKQADTDDSFEPVNKTLTVTAKFILRKQGETWKLSGPYYENDWFTLQDKPPAEAAAAAPQSE